MIKELSRIKMFLTQRSQLKALVIKSFRMRYSNTVLGFLWTVLTPLLISLVISFVFIYIAQVKIDNFSIYVISGMLPWICFSSSLQESAVSFVDNSGLYKQFMIPLEFIPTSCVIINFINLIIGLGVAIVFFANIQLKEAFLVFLLPIPVILHLLFTLGISFFLSSVYARRRDVAHMLNIILLFWLWSSPVFYSLESFPPYFRSLSTFNIMIPFLNLYRSIFFKHVFFDLKDILLAVFFASLSFIFGFGFFIRQEKVIKKII